LHTKATISYKNNYISLLKDGAHNDIADHDGKAVKLFGMPLRKE
jgi:hypothetical protein